ncbi:putative glycosyltransferase [Rhodococcoides trifolii]|uniref:Glycosyltransferase n=1 Tax=Rhodococcoides trifolii TaxID=908250 RepID=A0A917CSW2_9NOCA|nr:putative glycosyltransferase [Rhodococcus trifolii]
MAFVTTLLRRRPRLLLVLLLVGTAAVYLTNLSSQKWGNAFYAAAVQAGSVSWKAFLFGSSDAANSITVDKPPASLWIMEISVRIFGLNSWSVLAPQVLLGVLSVGILYATVERKFGYGAGLLAGLVLALTPTVALMFRYDNPDALLTLLMVCAAWSMLRALDDGRTRWLVLTGVFVGFGFIAKQLEVFLPLPGIALAYLLFGPPQVGRRIRQLLAALAALVVSAGWWVAIVQLTPASDRPWVGGSKTNSILDLTLGYNGFGRLTGNEGRGGGRQVPSRQDTEQMFPGGFSGFGGRTGITRLFADAQGGQIAWLIPAALVLAIAGIVLRGRAPRADFRRAWYVMWGVWLVGAGVVFSFMSGTFHAYYTMTLAPAIAAIVAVGAVDLWSTRERNWARIVLALTLLLTTATSFAFLNRTPDFLPWLRWTVMVAGVVAALALLVRPVRIVAVVAILAALGGPIAYVAQTIATTHSGGGPSAGPSIQRQPQARSGGGVESTVPAADVTALLEHNASSYTWVAATVGSNAAAGYQLATQDSVMPIGGFSGGDPSPTLAQFEQYVHDGRVHYFIGGSQGSKGRPSDIAAWVDRTYDSRTVGNATVYDLTAAPK